MTSNSWEGAVYLGLANLVFLSWALTRKKGRHIRPEGAETMALAGMIFFTVIAGGEALHIGGHVTPLHLPGVILAKAAFVRQCPHPRPRHRVRPICFLGLALAQAERDGAALIAASRRGADWR